ncbi:uncharacterized protein SPSK_02660 [Sporothrix schenckii 1099-18]|uniref:Uncharacterized protein n=2 Tax=Sporothrix schenckii TaxID=29908 RepID=U7PQQ0_SPOS1|nr:uncharacterized protein SPSK_02660 [Sporothrix schenckii 1099-18]ERS97271.1 hypothetical protein HMPREF1624_06602 [Sporothrix schenckii ATCC 58251]KJR86503.1 hypothetical protein SPSK_02660 [Sporothrix schenckii 1099-18]
MKTGSASALLFLVLQGLGSTHAYEKDGKHFINWDAHEYPIVAHWNWHRPFPDHGDPPMGFETKCNVVKKFHARNYRLGDLRNGEGHPLYPFSDGIEKFIAGRTYPGSWDGVDHGGMQRDLLMMEWRELPVYVRKWIEDHEMRRPEMDDGRTWRFMVFQKKSKKAAATATEPAAPLRAIPTEGAAASTWTLPEVADRDKVVFFAPGQLYPILPLFNAKGGGKCEDSFADLSRYVPAAKDDAVVAWPFEHSKPDPEHGKVDIYFKIRTEHVLESDHGRDRRLMWDALMRNARRSDRKHTRAEREAGRDSLGMPERDEL